MFGEIFRFEIQSRLRRPAVYLYFAGILIFTLFAFSTGSLPVLEKEHINSPFLISFWCCALTMLMTLVSSSVMGTAVFRDIEYQTKDYYLTYPITRAGYFWGRFAGSFVFMIGIALAIPLGIWLGSHLGPAIGKTVAVQYGPNKPMYYLYPFLLLALPNILFTSMLFYGLVAVLRNVKVIYFGGLLLFLFYFMALFFLDHYSNNAMVIGVADPFALNGVRSQMMNSNYLQQNNSLIAISGPLAINRLLWPGIGLLVLVITYLRFNFETFFAGRRDKAAADETSERSRAELKTPALSFTGVYNRRVLGSLVRLELMNIIRDNYFWVIVGVGSLFLGFVFWMGQFNEGVPDYPRTVLLLSIFSDAFPFFIFFIILFYTGETLQRDRLTRYAYINDSLPPPNWVLNGSKLISLLVLSIGLSLLPVVVGVVVQLAKGYTQLNWNAWLTYLFIVLLPKFLEAAALCYVIQVVFNNKFAGYAIAAPLWIGMFFLDSTGTFNYHLLLYSYTPNSGITDMDGMGHMVMPITWFDLYWMLGACLLIVIAALWYHRGVSHSLKECWQLIAERLSGATKGFAAVLLLLFFAVGGYIYYNVSYLNEWLTKDEQQDRAIIYEKALKKYQQLPLPSVTNIVESIDLYPEEKRAVVDAQVTIENRTDKPISQMLLDADGLTDYTISTGGQPVPVSYPLMYRRGKFSLFGPAADTADFRLYTFRKPLTPGDSAVLEVRTVRLQKGFMNQLYAPNLLNNGTLFTGGLPGLGYDDDDEVGSPYVRRKAGLPPKTEEEIAQNDPVGINTLKAGAGANLHRMEVTVSVPGDQTAVSHGDLVGQWTSNGRHYFHYGADRPGMYPPFVVVAARYMEKRDSVLLDHPVAIETYYNPAQGTNLDRFIKAYKDGLVYYSQAYGSYPYRSIRQAEISNYGPREASTTAMNLYSEMNGWNAHFTDPNQYDYLHFEVTRALAQQWWRYQVAPNNTVGSLVLSEGLAAYDALVMNEKKYGVENMRRYLLDQLWPYIIIRRRLTEREHPVLTANFWFEWSPKAGVVLYGLRDLIGEDSINKALREFRDKYAFRARGPYAGANDLYDVLRRHVPDSLQYYLDDTWKKVTFYDNKIVGVSAVKTGRANEYAVTIRVNIDKSYRDDNGDYAAATGMKDYIEIGVLGADAKDSSGRTVKRFLHRKKYWLTQGEHTMTIMVTGEPKAVAVDPLGTLIDQNEGDNYKRIE
jgi:ABC-type transport system involved in multi-copper enzyme maturation permease subunit